MNLIGLIVTQISIEYLVLCYRLVINQSIQVADIITTCSIINNIWSKIRINILSEIVYFLIHPEILRFSFDRFQHSPTSIKIKISLFISADKINKIFLDVFWLFLVFEFDLREIFFHLSHCHRIGFTQLWCSATL